VAIYKAGAVIVLHKIISPGKGGRGGERQRESAVVKMLRNGKGNIVPEDG
jgi:hypothetical protein